VAWEYLCQNGTRQGRGKFQQLFGNENGIRIALGARVTQVMRMPMGEAGWMTLIVCEE
jgi:hypothetical protein